MTNPLKKYATLLISLAIIAISGTLSYYWITNKPRAERKASPVVAPLVEIVAPQPIAHQTTVFGLGQVIPAQSVNLNSRVDGMVVSVSDQFIEGGFLKKDDEIVRLDPTDYELRVRQAQSELERAQFNLKIELGQQAIAQREYQLLGQELGELDELARALVQRKPHLEVTKADLDAAEATLEQAQLNLSRTRTIAPFNAVVTARNADVGSWVSTGTPLVQLVATDFFWIDVSLPIDKLRWIDIPGFNGERGSPVRVSYEKAWGADRFRLGAVRRLKAEVEPEGRMAKLLVEVEDPLGLKSANQNSPRMMLGTLVRAAIAGKTLVDVLPIPETAVHDGNRLWLMSENDTLEIVKIEPAWTEQGLIYLHTAELPERPRIIISDLSAPVQGMRIRTTETASSHQPVKHDADQ